MSAAAKPHMAPRSWPAVQDDDIPILFEDEEEPMGTANPHAWAEHILFGGLVGVLARRWPDHQVFRDLNCYYKVKGKQSPRTGRNPNFASDLMIVRPNIKLPFETTSYTIGVDGPPPVAAIEILSEETAAVRDLKVKLALYRKLGIGEYILVDLTGEFLAEKILLKRLQASGKWKDMSDSDGGLTSQLGFRLIIDGDDPLGLFVIDAQTGKRLARPHEANAAEEKANAAEEKASAAIEKLRRAEERIQSLQAENDRLRGRK
jgi:Uma2 family endonuclease